MTRSSEWKQSSWKEQFTQRIQIVVIGCLSLSPLTSKPLQISLLQRLSALILSSPCLKMDGWEDRGSVLPYGDELCGASGLCGASADEEGRRHVVSGTYSNRKEEEENMAWFHRTAKSAYSCFSAQMSSPFLTRDVMWTPKLSTFTC